MDTSGTDERDRDRGGDRSGLDIGTAARQLGISPAALKKRIQRGQQPASKQDGRWQVVLNGAHRGHVSIGTAGTGQELSVSGQGTFGETGDTSGNTEGGQAVAALERALEYERRRADEAVQQVIAAREIAAMYQERVRNLEEDNRRLSAQLALPAPAPASPPDPIEVLRVQVEQIQARLEAPRAPWWRFWRRG